jgi:FPC/CPF motif-containing protein YcgG
MEIIVREKRSRSARHHHSIFDALNEGIFATVAFNSIAAIESIAYGVPAFVSVPCAASPLASTDLTKILTPFYPDETVVQQHCSSLAYGQFTPEEIENGTAHKILTRNIK